MGSEIDLMNLIMRNLRGGRSVALLGYGLDQTRLSVEGSMFYMCSPNEPALSGIQVDTVIEFDDGSIKDLRTAASLMTKGSKDPKYTVFFGDST